MLQVKEITAAYGPITALHDVSLEVPDGNIVAVLGANGAGKTSTLRAISGLLRPSSGSIEFEEQRIDHLAPEEIVSRGVVQVPEGRELFVELTVLENLRLGAYARRDRDEVKRDLQQVFAYFPILAERKNQMAGTLSGGEQQMLAMARGLMARPRVLLLDEPSLGLAPKVTQEIFEIIQTINQEGKVSILLVEQNANLALSIADLGYVLETGRIVLKDSGQNLRQDEAVRRSYLGY
jgi:branched-chain amino acid transport system ATP-binding protein